MQQGRDNTLRQDLALRDEAALAELAPIFGPLWRLPRQRIYRSLSSIPRTYRHRQGRLQNASQRPTTCSNAAPM